jgi:hypothetical protein
MKNITVQLTIDRHISNGSARLQGRVNSKDVSVSVSRGTSDGTARVRGQWGPEDKVDLDFHRDVNEGYNRIDGSVGSNDVNARLHREVGGDTDMRMEGGRYHADRNQKGDSVQINGTDVRGGFTRQLRDGDEQGEFRLNGEKIRFSIDRDTKSGDFEISGRSSDGRFSLQATRDRHDGDLSLSGTLPEGSEMFPLFWEVLGDDKNIPDRNPLYPGSLLGMSMFFDQYTAS